MERITSLDGFKVIGSFMIVVMHAKPFGHAGFVGDYPAVLASVLSVNIARFMVPFMFMVSGYFLGVKLLKAKPDFSLFWIYFKRLMLIFCLWSLFYIIAPINWHSSDYGYWELVLKNINHMITHPMDTVTQGTMYHLWFLPALILGIAYVTTMVRLKKEAWILPIALLIHIFGLLMGSYAKTDFGVEVLFNTRNGPFFSFIYLSLGWFLSKHRFELSNLKTVAMIIAGLGIQLIEVYYIYKQGGLWLTHYDYTVGTLLFSMGIMLFSLNNPRLFANTVIVKLAPLSLGVYVIHIFFNYPLISLKSHTANWVFEILIPILIFLVSLASVWVLGRIKFIRSYVIS